MVIWCLEFDNSIDLNQQSSALKSKRDCIVADTTINHIQLVLKESIRDVAGEGVREEAQKFLNIDTGKVKSGKIFLFSRFDKFIK